MHNLQAIQTRTLLQVCRHLCRLQYSDSIKYISFVLAQTAISHSI